MTAVTYTIDRRTAREALARGCTVRLTEGTDDFGNDVPGWQIISPFSRYLVEIAAHVESVPEATVLIGRLVRDAGIDARFTRLAYFDGTDRDGHGRTYAVVEFETVSKLGSDDLVDAVRSGFDTDSRVQPVAVSAGVIR